MLEYVIVINGTALDRTAGFLYDVNEVKVIRAIDDDDAYNQTKGIKKALEGTLHIPDLKVSRLAPVGEDVLRFFNRM